MHEFDSLFRKDVSHQVRGLLLAIQLAAVGDRRTVNEITCPRGAIIKLPESLLIPGRVVADVLALEER